MALETGTYISDLVATNPPASDALSQADDHLRLIKALIKATFPNINGAMNATPTELNQLSAAVRTLGLANGLLATPSLYFDSDTDLGFFRAAANRAAIAGRLSGNGAVPVGSKHEFFKVPTASTLGTASSPGTTYDYLETNGAAYLIADYPYLYAEIGTTFGGNGVTTFAVPDTYTAGKFTRSRTASLAVGTAQTSAIKNHVHPFSGTTDSSGSHGHTATVTDPGHTHVIDTAGASYIKAGSSSGPSAGSGGGGGSGAPSNQTAFTGITVANATDGAHTHTHSGTTSNNTSGDASETRPEALAVIMCIKT